MEQGLIAPKPGTTPQQLATLEELYNSILVEGPLIQGYRNAVERMAACWMEGSTGDNLKTVASLVHTSRRAIQEQDIETFQECMDVAQELLADLCARFDVESFNERVKALEEPYPWMP
jgi:mevalonate kinase